MEETVKQAIKYGIVGVSNTVITAVVIWIMMKLFGCSDVVSNMVGYVAGVLNSFIWNKQWTFRSSAGWIGTCRPFRCRVRSVLSVAIGAFSVCPESIPVDRPIL